MTTPDIISCWWCGSPNTRIDNNCHECGAENKKPKMDWDKVMKYLGIKDCHHAD